MSDYYDYAITLPSTPAFSNNIEVMVTNIINAEGTCPTFVTKYKDGDKIPETDPAEYEQNPFKGTDPMVSTKLANGKIQLHFRLPLKLSEPSLLVLLKEGMANPKPPIQASSIRSAFKNVYIDDGLDEEEVPIGHYEYDVIMQAQKATFLQFMPDIQDGEDQDGNPIYRPPNNTDQLFLSGYFGSEPVELT